MSERAPAAKSRDYRAHLVCTTGGPWLSGALDQAAAWLREKSFDVDFDHSGDYRQGTSVLTVRRESSGAFEDAKVILHETNPTGTWTTELLVHSEVGSRGWINLSVSSGDDKFVKVPRLAGYLMKALPLGDGLMEFVDGHRWMGTDDVPRLIELLADPERHGLVFVAGTNADSGVPVDAFAKKVGEWAKQVYGLAEVIVLDPAGTEEMIRKVGPAFAAPEWTIRTYQPGVRFDEMGDARRHRILGIHSLTNRSDRAIVHLLGEVARAQAATRTEDPSVLKVRRRFDRIENRRLVESVVVPEAEPVETPPEPLVQEPADAARSATKARTGHEDVEISFVKRILGLARITEHGLRDLLARASRPDVDRSALNALEHRVDDLQQAVERLQDENRDLRTTLEDAQLELELSQFDVEDRDARIAWLHKRLKEDGDYEAAYAEVPEEFRATRPASFGELLTRLEQIPCVEFTGDPDEVEKLNQVDTNDAALRTAWDAVLALQDYARARADGACDKGLAHYLRHTPSGYQTFPHGKFAENETGVTMQGYGDQRIFPVPTEIDAKGSVAMKTHFKLARIGMRSPRMHVYDGHPGTAKIYIGYLGSHLDNTQTN